ncbi:Di-haem cytochrome c peroxidase family [Verrucomicrobiia bacterium DG1235]|nr:Di-haem cytochrome c peroxidase family [Verrucomicrobiae bacterium DG1235]
MNAKLALTGVACVAGLCASLTSAHAKRPFFLRYLPAPLVDSDYYDNNQPPEDKVILGNFLFFDKILSGNKNISCATCHHPLTDLGDGLALSVGEGGQGIGITRNTGIDLDAIHERVPRNAPPVFELGAKSAHTLFHDGRVQVDPSTPSGFASPAGDDLPLGLDNVLAAQAMFPVTSSTEMAGQIGENPIADATALGDLAGPDGVWNLLAQRLQSNATYVSLFIDAFPEIDEASDITFAHAANAIAAFEASSWQANNSRFDQFLRGDLTALTWTELQGMMLFYGKARCSQCHSGPLMSDFDFHAIALPQVGPGKGNGIGGREDFGREAVTDRPEDRFRFRTPILRNIALTAPYGHDGAYNSLEAIVRHHLDPVYSLYNYDRNEFIAPSRPDLDAIDFAVMDDPSLVAAIAEANELQPNHRVNNRDVQKLLAFLRSLTDQQTIDLRLDTPRSVPSGLSIVE